MRTGEGELEWCAEGEGVDVLQERLDDGRRFGEVESARSEAKVGGRLGRRARGNGCLLLDLDARVRLPAIESSLLDGEDSLGAILEVVHLLTEPSPSIVQELPRASQSLPVGADDLKVGEKGLRKSEEAEGLGKGRERLGRRLVDSEALEVDEGDVGEVRLSMIVVRCDIAICTASQYSVCRRMEQGLTSISENDDRVLPSHCSVPAPLTQDRPRIHPHPIESLSLLRLLQRASTSVLPEIECPEGEVVDGLGEEGTEDEEVSSDDRTGRESETRGEGGASHERGEARRVEVVGRWCRGCKHVEVSSDTASNRYQS